MQIAWPDLAAALGLLFVIEGLLPFASPAALRRALAAMHSAPDAVLRAGGAVSIAGGLLLLWFARH